MRPKLRALTDADFFSCDWGGCDEEAVLARYDLVGREWLPVCGPHSTSRRDHPDRCGDAALHTPCPDDYVSWHAWAKEMSRTHTNERCPSCNFWLVWRPRSDHPSAAGATQGEAS